MVGDLNAICCLDEKRGGVARLDPSALLLNVDINLLNVIDVKENNGIFTWNNKRCGEEAISERLDRFLVSFLWMGVNWSTSSEILDWGGLDHWPIKLSTKSFIVLKNPSFKFQLMWLRDISLQDLMPIWWAEGKLAYGWEMYSFVKILQYVKYKLKRWNKQCFGNLHSNKINAQVRLDNITRLIRNQMLALELQSEEKFSIKDLEEWELSEEIFSKQKSRIDWLQEGDGNTAFFNNFVEARRNGNLITYLMSTDGVHLSSIGDISREASQYFQALFSEDSPCS